jgi:hypothetical protein
MAIFVAYEKRMMACLGHMEANIEKTVPDPEMMQSVEEHQEIPREDAIVKPTKGRRKRRRGRKSTAGRRGEPKELTRGNCESLRKLAVACMKVSRHAKVAWRKKKRHQTNLDRSK